jgi:hypothetical protein
MENATLQHTIRLFHYYKELGEKAMAQVPDHLLSHAPDQKSNSIAVIVKHLSGNMLSRWTDFLTSDGEKEWRHRDAEFEEENVNRHTLNEWWEKGWQCLFDALHTLTPVDLQRIVYIRNMGQTAEDTILRQLAHYSYHIGQIVYLARWLNEGDWTSLSIPRGASRVYNTEKTQGGKRLEHFTDKK